MEKVTLTPADSPLGDALQRHTSDDPILLMQNSAPVGLVVKLPEGAADEWQTAQVRAIFASETGVFIEIVPSLDFSPTVVQPVFGNCRGMLTIHSDDDDHLKEFAEYME